MAGGDHRRVDSNTAHGAVDSELERVAVPLEGMAVGTEASDEVRVARSRFPLHQLQVVTIREADGHPERVAFRIVVK